LYGVLTTIIGIGTFAFFARVLNVFYIYANILAWTVAVIFAYYTNRKFVFHSTEKNKKKEFIRFVTSRVLTLLLDTLLMFTLIGIIGINDIMSKTIVQILVIIANYVIGKFIIFKK